MKNIQPWCISRQLWWGHQIPAWFGPDGQVFVEETEEAAVAEAEKYYGEPVILKRDEDVLDTWFSSALWPFSTLGWPNQTKELEKYYPGEVLVTGFDIIFFWVARMMMMGLHFMKEVPFQTVYIHALVRDEKGQKMSKSKGNVLDPLDLIGKYGSDALRFTLAAMAAQGRDIKLAEGRIEGYRNFATKLWNAARFAQLNSCSYEPTFQPNLVVSKVNKWIISETVQMVRNIEIAIASYRFNDAANIIYQFTWATFCDWYLEFTKPLLANSENVLLKETRATTSWVLKQIFNSLNPLMPYITEELWEQFEFGGLLINEEWPTFDENLIAPDATKEISWVIAFVNEIRSTRSAANIDAKSRVQVLMKKFDKERISYVEANEELIVRLGNLKSLKSTEDEFPKGTIQSVVEGNLFGLVITEGIDFENEKGRISKDLIKIKREMAKFESKLSNEKFLEKAPEEVIQETRNRLDEAKKKADKLDQVLEGFNLS